MRNDAVTRLVSRAMVEFPCGMLGTEKPVMNSSRTRGMSEGRISLGGPALSFEESGNGMQKPPPPQIHSSITSSPPTRVLKGNKP